MSGKWQANGLARHLSLVTCHCFSDSAVSVFGLSVVSSQLSVKPQAGARLMTDNWELTTRGIRQPTDAAVC